MHVKKGDQVQVISGKEKGRRGVIKTSIPTRDRVVVENINIVKKHVKQQGTRPGGILEVEAALHVSNVMLVCPSCGKASRTGHRTNEAGKKVRFCKACDADVD